MKYDTRIYMIDIRYIITLMNSNDEERWTFQTRIIKNIHLNIWGKYFCTYLYNKLKIIN